MGDPSVAVVHIALQRDLLLYHLHRRTGFAVTNGRVHLWYVDAIALPITVTVLDVPGLASLPVDHLPVYCFVAAVVGLPFWGRHQDLFFTRIALR